jgi:hypothetical protein
LYRETAIYTSGDEVGRPPVGGGTLVSGVDTDLSARIETSFGEETNHGLGEGVL